MDLGLRRNEPYRFNCTAIHSYKGNPEMKIKMISLVFAAAVVALVVANSQPQPTKARSQIYAYAFEESYDAPNICVPDAGFKGCCSWKSGIKDVRGDYVVCLDGAASPTCTAKIESDLRGCCKDHDGIDGVLPDGTVKCLDGQVSPTCGLDTCAVQNLTRLEKAS